jgi:tetratricopeptide (TPR) repeat protein
MKSNLILLVLIIFSIKLFSQTAVDFVKKGNAKQEISNFKGAIKEYNKAIKIDPKNNEAYFQRAICKTNLGDYYGAVLDYKSFNELLPNIAGSYYNSGLCRSKINDLNGALRDYNKSITIDPKNNPEVYFNRGLIKFKLNDKDGACMDWSKAGELGMDVYDTIKQFCN